MNRKNRLGLTPFVAVILLAVIRAGCYPPVDLLQERSTPMPENTLNGSEWQLATVNETPAVVGAEATLLFADGRITGTTGCNRYTGSYTLGEDGAIDFGPLASTMMACAEPQMQQEMAFGKALEVAVRYTVSVGALILSDANGVEVAIFVPRKAFELVGPTWTAYGINNGRQAVVNNAATSRVNAVFGADGFVTGSAGCNNYRAAYTVDGNKISIQPPVSTRRLCVDDEVMEQETNFLNALPRAATYRIDGDKLQLRDDGGALQAGFRAQ